MYAEYTNIDSDGLLVVNKSLNKSLDFISAFETSRHPLDLQSYIDIQVVSAYSCCTSRVAYT